VTARGACRPIFYDLLFENAAFHGFSCSDFSEPIIWNCEFSEIAGEEFCIFDGSRPTIYFDSLSGYTGRLKEMTEGSHNRGFGSLGGYLSQPPLSIRKPEHTGAQTAPSPPVMGLEGDTEEDETGIVKETIEIITGKLPGGSATLHLFGDQKALEGHLIRRLRRDPRWRRLMSVQWNGPRNDGEDRWRLERPEDMRPAQMEMDPDELISKCNRTDDPCGQVFCYVCEKEKADVICWPCCHRVLCANCAQEKKPLGEPCPLCSTRMGGCTPAFVEDQCVVCKDHRSDTVLLTCGHQRMCRRCAIRIFEEVGRCPECQQEVVWYKHQFALPEKE
jgi:hypothetical protein